MAERKPFEWDDEEIEKKEGDLETMARKAWSFYHFNKNTQIWQGLADEVEDKLTYASTVTVIPTLWSVIEESRYLDSLNNYKHEERIAFISELGTSSDEMIETLNSYDIHVDMIHHLYGNFEDYKELKKSETDFMKGIHNTLTLIGNGNLSLLIAELAADHLEVTPSQLKTIGIEVDDIEDMGKPYVRDLKTAGKEFLRMMSNETVEETLELEKLYRQKYN